MFYLKIGPIQERLHGPGKQTRTDESCLSWQKWWKTQVCPYTCILNSEATEEPRPWWDPNLSLLDYAVREHYRDTATKADITRPANVG